MNLEDMNKEALIPLVRKFATQIQQQVKEITDLENRLKNTDDALYWYETEYKKLQTNYDTMIATVKRMDVLTNRFKASLVLRDELLKDVYSELDHLRSKGIPYGAKLEKTLIHISKVTKEKEPETAPLSTLELRHNDNPPKDINNTHNIYKSTTRLLDIIG